MKVEAKVGIFVILSLIGLLVLSAKLQTVSYVGKDGYILYAKIDNASGIENNTKVKISGVDAGYVNKISLEKGKAKLSLFIFNNIEVSKDSQMIITQESMLGGKYIDLIYGNSDEKLTDSDYIQNHKSYASIEQTSQNISDAAVEIKEFVKKLDKTLDDETIKNFKQAVLDFKIMAQKLSLGADEFGKMGNMVNEKLPKIIAQVDKLTYEFASTGIIINSKLPDIMNQIDGLSYEFNKTGNTINNRLPNILEQFTKIEMDVASILNENKKPLNETIKKAGDFFQTGEVAFSNIDKKLSKIDTAELQVGIRSEYLLRDQIAKTYFSLNYLPNPTNYYMFDVVSGYEINKNDPATQEIILPKSHQKGDSFISAQFGKRYSDLLFRAGIIEGSGGLGIDYFMYSDKLKTSFEIFDFNAVNDIRGTNPHGKFLFKYTPYKHVSFFGGYDNFLNERSQNLFLGFGIGFIDDDLKNLLISGGLSGAVSGK